MICPFSLLACPMMSSWSWRCRMRCRFIRSGLLVEVLFGLPRPAAARLSSRSSRRLTRLDCPPRLLVSGSGELGRLVSLLPAVVCLVPGGGVACFVGDGQLMCRFCGCPFNRLIARVPSGIVFLVPYPRFVDRFFEWFFAINCLFPPPIRPVGVSPRSLLCFFLSLGATGAIFFHQRPLPQYILGGCLLA